MLFHSSLPLPTRLVCYGASGTGVQIALDLRHQAKGQMTFIGYVDDVNDPRRRPEAGYPVLSFDDLLGLEDVGVFVSVHDPQGRRHLYERLTERGIPLIGARGAEPFAHPDAVVGEGSFITSSTRLGHTAQLGRGVLGLGNLIAHDVEIGDFTTLAAGSMVLGHVQIGAGAFIGAGAIIQNGTLHRPRVIGDGAVVGAGAVVSRDVAAGETVTGLRAMPVARWRTLLGGKNVSSRP